MVDSSVTAQSATIAIAPVQRRLGRYDIIAELARGGMGIVFLARHAGEAGFQRLFAIKILHSHLADDQSFVAMLQDEARLAARLHHPSVVPIVDLGTQDGHYFVVMEYVEGCTLAHLLRRNLESRSPRLLVPIMIDALDGLHAAHTLTDDAGRRLNLVHRDFSPQNVLIGIDGASRITDFGIAKAETRVTATAPGTRKGKLAYMAPEQMLDDGARIDRRADVFAAGAVLWNALTGLSLFRGESDAATLHNILHKVVPPPSLVGLKPPKIFDEVCQRALERNPDKRFESALEFAEALRQIAIAHRVLGSRVEVAHWVTSSFGTEFEERRKAIREAAQRPQSPHGTLGSVPPLPEITAPASLPGATAHSVSLQVSGVAPAAVLRQRRALYAGAGALVLLLTVVIWLLARGGGAESAAAPAGIPSGVAPAARGVSLAPPVAAAATAQAPVATEAPASPTPASSPKAKPPAPILASRLAQARAAPRALPATSSRLPAGKPSEAAAPPVADEQPLPKPASESPFERNPYLRKK